MKIFKTIQFFAVIMLAAASVSCNNDDDGVKPIIPGPPTGTEIRYEISVSTDMIDYIQYKQANNTTEEGELFPEDPTQWNKSIVIPFVYLPYTVDMRVDFINPTTATQSYTLKIFHDNELVKTATGTVNPDDPEIEEPVKVTRTITFDVVQ